MALQKGLRKALKDLHNNCVQPWLCTCYPEPWTPCGRPGSLSGWRVSRDPHPGYHHPVEQQGSSGDPVVHAPRWGVLWGHWPQAVVVPECLGRALSPGLEWDPEGRTWT